jgi:gamma-glutamyltranspeptidase/glutathione hydrolase
MKKIVNLFLSSCLFLCTINSSFAISPLPAAGKYGMVVSEQQAASQIGLHILREGGNAIDAAVAVGYALAVVDPCCGNIGGGGFMLIHLAEGKNIVLNFREKAPLAATPYMFLDPHGKVIPNKNIVGYLSVAVPGTVLGLNTALEKYGSMTRKQVMEPAINLARHGFIIGPTNAKVFAEDQAFFLPQANVASIFLKNGKPYHSKDKLLQPQLANTLQQIADEGSDAFYKGSIAKAMVKASQENGGILSLEDFADYTVEELAPIRCNYRDYNIISAAPPSSGGIALCEMLNILSGYPLSSFGFHSARSIHYIAEAMRFAFFDRTRLGDPDFIHNPVDQLISSNYAAQIRSQIQSFHAISSSELGTTLLPYESQDTTHYSVIDKEGNAVAVTYTLNGFFGAKVIADDTGFFLNDSMDDFTIRPQIPNQFHLIQGLANGIQGGKRPLSSMTPTIITKDDHLFMVLGSPGGPRIITSVLQTILNVIDYGMNIQEAVDAPRFHHQWWPDMILFEPFAISQDTNEKLADMGYSLIQHAPWSAVAAILVEPTKDLYYGANDDRRPSGKAVGY